jgi:hypothetical protein
VGVALIALGALLAPVSILSTWAVTQVTDTDRFVATFAPLGADDEVQAYLASRVTEAIEEQVDFPALVDPFFDAVTADLGSVGTLAADAVKGLVQQGARQLLSSAVSGIVESDAFSATFEQSLRVSHTILVRALTDDPDALVQLAPDGTIGVQLGPIVEGVKQRLIDSGLGFAAAIPEVDRVIPLATSESLVRLRGVYAVAQAVGFWLPWAVVALLVGGLLILGRGIRSVIASAGALAGGVALLLVGTGIGRAVALRELDALGLPPGVASLVFDRVVGDIVSASVWVLCFALLVALLCWVVPIAAARWQRRKDASAPA